MSNTVPCFKETWWKYLTVLRRSKMSLVLQFELILKIGSINCAYGGCQKNISRAPWRRIGQGCLRLCSPPCLLVVLFLFRVYKTELLPWKKTFHKIIKDFILNQYEMLIRHNHKNIRKGAKRCTFLHTLW
jgi:hypothetical protein